LDAEDIVYKLEEVATLNFTVTDIDFINLCHTASDNITIKAQPIMKPKIYLLNIAVLAMLAGCTPTHKEEQFKEYHSTTFQVENGIKSKKTECRIVQEFDAHGDVIKTSYYDNDVHTLSSYTTRQFDTNRNTVIYTSFDPSGKKLSWSENLLQNEKIICHKDFDADGHLVMTIKSKYDDKGRQTEVTYLKGSTNQLQKLVNEYDAMGTVTQLRYDSNGNMEHVKTVSKYDKKHNLTELDWIDSSSKTVLSFKYTYSAGKCRKEIHSDGDKAFKKRIYKYKNGGDVITIYTYERSETDDTWQLREIHTTSYKY
jgi:hypothetical protein